MSKIYLKVNYKDKNEAKQMGLRWNSELKMWYIPDNISGGASDAALIRFGKAYDEYVYLNVDYKDKHIIKLYGGKWDSKRQKWYIPRNIQTINYDFLLSNFQVLFRSETLI